MNYPVHHWSLWYSAQAHGVKTDYGYHDGEDINLKTGGNTDEGQDILAIADGIVTSVHIHTNSNNFGKHIHIAHEGSWGKVWCHFAHCSDILVQEGDQVKGGQVVAKVGRTGTVYSHLHWAIKREPTRIDGIARTQEDLKKWTAPIPFVETWMKGNILPTSFPQELLKYGKGSLDDLVAWVDQNILWLDEARVDMKTLTTERDNARSEVTSTQEALKSAKEDRVDYENSLTKLLPQSGYTKDKSGLVQRLTMATESEDKLVTVQKAFDGAKEDYQQKLEEASRKIIALENALAELKTQVIDLQNNIVHEQKKESFIDVIIRLLKGTHDRK